MSNKKRIRKLLKEKYKQSKVLPKSPLICSPATIDWKKIMSDFAIKAQFFANEAEKAGRLYTNFIKRTHTELILSNYSVIPRSLIEPQRPVFAMERIKYDIKEADDYYSKINLFPEGITDHLKKEALTQVSRIQNKALIQYLRKNLEMFGYVFHTEDEFLDFAKGRITRISFPGNMYRFEYYLDYGRKNGGEEILIGISNNKIEWIIEPNRVTVTIG